MHLLTCLAQQLLEALTAEPDEPELAGVALRDVLDEVDPEVLEIRARTLTSRGGGRIIEVKAAGESTRGYDVWLEERQLDAAVEDPVAAIAARPAPGRRCRWHNAHLGVLIVPTRGVDVLTVGEAAERLGVSGHEVRRLIRTGALPASRVGRTLVVDDEAVAARARLPIGAGRAFAPRTAWAALWELSGLRADWLDAPGRSRLRTRLSGLDPEQLVAATRGRAERHALRVLPAYRERVLQAEGVVPSGMTAAGVVGADVVATEAADEVYCRADRLQALRREFGLADRGEPNLVVRVPTFAQLPVELREQMPVAVVAVDLAESADVRTRRAGLTLLSDALASLGR